LSYLAGTFQPLPPPPRRELRTFVTSLRVDFHHFHCAAPCTTLGCTGRFQSRPYFKKLYWVEALISEDSSHCITASMFPCTAPYGYILHTVWQTALADIQQTSTGWQSVSFTCNFSHWYLAKSERLCSYCHPWMQLHPRMRSSADRKKLIDISLRVVYSYCRAESSGFPVIQTPVLSWFGAVCHLFFLKFMLSSFLFIF